MAMIANKCEDITVNVVDVNPDRIDVRAKLARSHRLHSFYHPFFSPPVCILDPSNRLGTLNIFPFSSQGSRISSSNAGEK